MMNLQDKRELLRDRIDRMCTEDVCLAFSGGVDSSLLLALLVRPAKKYGTTVHAVTFNTSLHPLADVKIASRVAQEAGARHVVLDVNEWEDEQLRHNPKNRCYLCKKLLFAHLVDYAREHGIRTVVEGTNQEELKGYRPGFMAVRELGIVSPLVDADFTKEEVRSLARELGVSVSERPSTPCLATRFPHGAYLDEKLFGKIETGEAYLRNQGFYNVRLRVHGEILRMEIDKTDFQRILEIREEIVEQMKNLGFHYITFDLEGFRSGSMDI